MALNIDEYRSRLKASEPGRERIQQLRAQIHEAVRATAVTGDANWDHYLAKVEGRIRGCEELIASEQRILCHPEMVNADKIMASKIKIICLESAAQALREIIDLPKMLIQNGAHASEVLAKLGTEPGEP